QKARIAEGQDLNRGRRALAILSLAELLGMSVWFAASPVMDQLRATWGLSVVQSGWFTTAVQLGFVAGTLVVALLNLADVIPSKWLFAGSALSAGLANASLLLAGGFMAAVAARFATGFFLAGVYPPGMKMAATWFRSGRGLAIGTLVGALTIGKATPYLIGALGGASVRAVVLTTTAAACVAAALVGLCYRDGPHAFERRPFSWSLAGQVLKTRRWRLATGGYLGHMWELYAFWAWVATYLTASAATRTSGGLPVPGFGALEAMAFGAIAVGGLGCVWGGRSADRTSYESLTVRALSASGVCCLLTPALFGASFWLVFPLVLVWGFFVVADSAQFSALVTEVVSPHAVGTALTLQTSAGFLLTMVTIQLVPEIAGGTGWRWAFPILALGPAFGIGSIRRLQRL
ncbi:MAG: MFS transporter, partial [Gemmatimonadota bacterium]